VAVSDAGSTTTVNVVMNGPLFTTQHPATPGHVQLAASVVMLSSELDVSVFTLCSIPLNKQLRNMTMSTLQTEVSMSVSMVHIEVSMGYVQ